MALRAVLILFLSFEEDNMFSTAFSDQTCSQWHRSHRVAGLTRSGSQTAARRLTRPQLLPEESRPTDLTMSRL